MKTQENHQSDSFKNLNGLWLEASTLSNRGVGRLKDFQAYG